MRSQRCQLHLRQTLTKHLRKRKRLKNQQKRKRKKKRKRRRNQHLYLNQKRRLSGRLKKSRSKFKLSYLKK